MFKTMKHKMETTSEHNQFSKHRDIKESLINTEEINSDFQKKHGLHHHTLLFKVFLHYFLVVYIHYYCFKIAYKSEKNMR